MFSPDAAEYFGQWMDRKGHLDVSRDPNKTNKVIEEMQELELKLRSLPTPLEAYEIYNAKGNAELIDINL